jgi:hypothetical protein
MRTTPLCLLLATLALACAEKDTTDDDDGGDEDEEVDTDGDGGGDGGGSGDGGGGSDSACSPIFPVDTARHTLHFASTDPDSESQLTWTTQYMGADTLDGQDAWRVDSVHETLAPTYESWTWISFWYTCDDTGVWVLGHDTDQTTTTEAGTQEYQSETRYTRPGLVAPAEVAVGTTWTQDGEYRLSDSLGNDDSHTVAVEYEVTDRAEVDVLAGTFDAFEITYQTTDEPYTYWAAPGVGSVKSGVAELQRIEE